MIVSINVLTKHDLSIIRVCANNLALRSTSFPESRNNWMDFEAAIWPTPAGQTIAESNGELVHIDALHLHLPDAHSTVFPVLAFPSSLLEAPPARQTVESPSPTTGLALIETFVHRLLAFSSIPVDLFIPPYSTPMPPIQTPSQPPRIGRIALHPELPIVALAQAHLSGFIFLFDLRTNAYMKYKLAVGNHHQVNSLKFSKYNLLAAGMSSGELITFDLNLSISASTSTKALRFSAIPSYAMLIPPQFPSFQLLGEITDLAFDERSARYIAIATTRSGTWIYDTIYFTSLRLSKYPSSAVAFSPNENLLAVARERTGEIEFYTLIRAGTLTFSLPTIAKSGYASTVTHMQWTSEGKSLLYCNDGQEGIRILRVEGSLMTPPGSNLEDNVNKVEARYMGNIPTPLRVTPEDSIPYGGVPTGFALDHSSRRLAISYSQSPLLEVFAFSTAVSPAQALSVGLIRGPSAGKTASEKAKGKRPEGQSPFEENSWVRALCVDVGFVGQGEGGKRSLLAGGWNGEDGGKLAFVPFYLEDLNA